jgi:transposase-like protein
MAKRTRRSFSPQFKAQVVLAALPGAAILARGEAVGQAG